MSWKTRRWTGVGLARVGMTGPLVPYCRSLRVRQGLGKVGVEGR